MKHFLSSLVFTSIIAVLGFGGYFVFGPKSQTGESTEPPPSAILLDQLESEGAIDFEVEDISGTKHKLSDYKGKVVILSFWASWCDPCVEEFPSLIRLIDKFSGDVVLIAISADYELGELKKFLDVFKLKSKNLIVAWDEKKEIAQKYHVQALPESFVLSKDLKLIRKVSGAENWSTPEAFEFFQSLIEK